MSRYGDSFTEAERNYFLHKYAPFDYMCDTEKQAQEICAKYIINGHSTADFELEKYLIHKRESMACYVIANFASRFDDWYHLLATAINSLARKSIVKRLCHAYYEVHGKLIEICPTGDDIMFTIFSCGFYDAYCAIEGNANLSIPFRDVIMAAQDNKVVVSMLKGWDMKDTKICRNLIYALLSNDVETVLDLLERGIRVDMWNNMAMNICLHKFLLEFPRNI